MDSAARPCLHNSQIMMLPCAGFLLAWVSVVKRSRQIVLIFRRALAFVATPWEELPVQTGAPPALSISADSFSDA